MVQETTGRLFHIDFGHFMEHRKKCPGLRFNRESDPFVFTNEMKRMIEMEIEEATDNQQSMHEEVEEYELLQEKVKPSNYDVFQDLCCQAYEVVRQNYTLFLNLLRLMVNARI